MAGNPAEKHPLKLAFNYESRIHFDGRRAHRNIKIWLTEATRKEVIAAVGRPIELSTNDSEHWPDEKTLKFIANHIFRNLREKHIECDPVIAFYRHHTRLERWGFATTQIDIKAENPSLE